MEITAVNSDEYISVNEIINNPKRYVDVFIKNGIIGFRNLFATTDEQQAILQSFGEEVGWFPNRKIHLSSHSYTESHSGSIGRRIIDSPDDLGEESILLPWHIERVGSANPQVAAAWNMQVFNASPNAGRTLFYDCSKLFNRMDGEDQEFLRLCEISGPTEDGSKKSDVIRSAVMIHAFTNQEILRICPSTIEFHELVRFESRQPSADELHKFDELKNVAIEQIRNDLQNRLMWNWEEGDLLIPDLLKMAHAVLGGFRSDERIFTGQWCYARLP